MVSTTSNDNTKNTDSQKKRGNAKRVGSLFLGIIVLLSAWIGVKYYHAVLPEYIAGILTPHGFVLPTVTVAFGGFILSIPLFRRLSRKNKATQVKADPIPRYRRPQSHPLFMTSRPARDTNFVIRKTKNRGRISRNRAGERLPPSYQE